MTIQNPWVPLPPVPAVQDGQLKNYLEDQRNLIIRLLQSINPGSATRAPIQRDGGLWIALADATTAGVISPTQFAAIGSLASTYQPLDADLTAIAALATDAFGRSLLTLGNAAALRSAAGFQSRYHYANVPFQCNGAASLGMGAHASTAEFLANSNRNITKFDATHFADVRLVVRITTGSASANTPRLRARQAKTFTTTLASYADIGASETAISLTTAGFVASSWIAIEAGNLDDLFLIVDQIGGDAAATPACGPIVVQFRGRNTEP